ncbi:MAG TPA: 1-acyl-sn-glycerol-3-phosphate acyltransferase [Bacteroidales bacterium]|nr:1-acyl-sn-glycerol-3-phosphate acyltransferase [Bacteroidales bacterium]
MRPSLLYRWLKIYVRLAFAAYYRRYRIHNPQNVPVTGPVIFAINHQNAFMDALVVAVSSGRNPWFITRASVFSNATARYWLGLLQMLPIYRFRDGHANMKKNDEAMESVRRLLQQDETILIFPEGNHDRHWALRPLQKGIARMAFDLEAGEGFQSGLHIVPVGLQYENHLRSYSDVLISFGAPIAVSNYRDLYETNPAQAINRLIADLAPAIRSLMVHIPENMPYDKVAELIQSDAARPAALVDRLQHDQQLVERLQAMESIADMAAPKRKRRFCLLAWLLFVLSVIPHLPLLGLARMIVRKAVRDDHWTSSITFATLLLAGPLIYLAEILALGFATGHWSVAILFALLLWPTARYSLWYRAG